ncbi:MAG: bifunctional phosphoribosyl-AMP cyclohydrolase/phosphoribosyl-ATP diphosphatase HisIE [Helicobacteraceae bacterium]|jgi:phosphoribosyl-ATP pyrophosphohydrolase/phosphoribosyl-AMP cyclohydrolase|nr:bifunctional phosphoribosyl-AMP cyclohydrolase/phosphoribosyl-ATP diphosphatase HisIE [Helicobacteraceae bacterium]
MQIDWSKTPLVPVIAQEAETKEVLMLAYANEDALNLTLSSGFAHYFSRSRERIWKKGETSGNVQKINRVLVDCDGDSLLYEVSQNGAACHTGQKSCFFTTAQGEKISEPVADLTAIYSITDRLYHTICERRNADLSASYVASLFAKGENAILKKVVEEAGEFALAMKDKSRNDAIYEAADLLFHSLIALAKMDISPDLIRAELARREGLSGITEKNSRAESGAK